MGKVTITCSEELMVHWPNGRVQFISGFFDAIKLLWFLTVNKIEVEFVQSER